MKYDEAKQLQNMLYDEDYCKQVMVKYSNNYLLFNTETFLDAVYKEALQRIKILKEDEIKQTYCNKAAIDKLKRLLVPEKIFQICTKNIKTMNVPT